MQATNIRCQLPQAQAAKTQRAAGPVAVLPRLAKAAGAGLAALTLAAGAHAATVRPRGENAATGLVRPVRALPAPGAALDGPRWAPMCRWQPRRRAGLAGETHRAP